MKKNSVEAKMAQFMVENAMGDITRATRKVLIDYISKMYYVPLAKAIAYLEIDDFEADGLLEYLDAQTRSMIIKCSKDFKKHEEGVISEVEHIITTSGMNLDDDYQIIKTKLLQPVKALQNYHSISSAVSLLFSRSSSTNAFLTSKI